MREDMGSKLFVGNLSFDTTKTALEQLFAEAGQIVDVFLPSDRATGRPRGFAFVEFSTPEEAAAAIERFDGYELNARALRVNEATEKPQGGPRGGGRPFEGGGGFGGGGGFEGGGNRRPGPAPARPKGSRRNVRARKRSL